MKQEIGFEKGRRHVSAQSTIPFEQRPTCTIAEACNAAGLGKTMSMVTQGTNNGIQFADPPGESLQAYREVTWSSVQPFFPAPASTFSATTSDTRRPAP